MPTLPAAADRVDRDRPPDERRLRTRNVCLDTSALVAARLNFAGPALARLTALAAQGAVRVFTTPIIRGEVEAQIEELAEAGEGAAAFRAKATRLSGVPLPPAVRAWFDTPYDRAGVARHMTKGFHRGPPEPARRRAGAERGAPGGGTASGSLHPDRRRRRRRVTSPVRAH